MPSSPYLSTAEVADYLRLTVTCKRPESAARKWIARKQLRLYPVGKSKLVLRTAVDAVLREEAAEATRLQSKRHRQAFHAGAAVMQGGR